MITRADLSEEHALLEEICGELLRKMGSADGPTAELSAIRWRMSRVLLVHLAKEDKYLYPELERSGEPRISTIARRFFEEMGGLADQYRTYAAYWTAERMTVDWSGFVADTRKIVLTLRQRILREERHLYPLLDPPRLMAAITA